jgi:hypothetical protein
MCIKTDKGRNCMAMDRRRYQMMMVEMSKRKVEETRQIIEASRQKNEMSGLNIELSQQKDETL